MGYRPALDNELTRHFIALGDLEWKAIDGVRYVKLTPQGYYHLEQLRHAETQEKLSELEAVCRQIIKTYFDSGPSLEREKSLLALLDILPPSDVS